MFNCPTLNNNFATGFIHLGRGLRLILHPKLRPFILIPIAVNCFIFVVLTGILVQINDSAVDFMRDFFPAWMAPVFWLAWIVFGTAVLLAYAWTFNIITNFIAAPFYGVLAERTERLITGEAPSDESLIKMVPRVLGRECSKLFYFLTRGFIVGLIMILFATIPLVQFLAPLIGLAWGAWSMTIQYVDYSADNHQFGFKPLRQILWHKKYSSFGFGSAVMVCTLIPIVNIFVMPAAVVGGTLLWAHELKGCKQAQERLAKTKFNGCKSRQ